ncbi:MAG: NAD(P)/FAD-dependent oxidoreductase [Erysipelotrichaceae bacterium]
MIRIRNIKLKIDHSEADLDSKVSKLLRCSEDQIDYMRIIKKSLDARKQEQFYFIYVVDVQVKNEQHFHLPKNMDVSKVIPAYYKAPKAGELELKDSIAVIGFGPAGMFSALMLAQNGYKVNVYERGNSIEERINAVDKFWKEAILDEESNVQFGEGGAGTFSDGKLTTRIKDIRVSKVLETFVEFGAPEEILYEAFPHIGSDIIRDVVVNIRKEIIKLGGTINFNSKFEKVNIESNELVSIVINGETIPCTQAILAIGHSARDTFKALHEQGIAMEPKAFAVGFRIEHKQALINEAQYKNFANNFNLPVAEYHLTHNASNGRGVYTFCMCPGGEVVASTSLKEHVVVNGMSNYARNGDNANSAILVQITPNDYGEGILAGLNFQEELEKKAYIMGGSNYKAPAQRLVDYMNNIKGDKLGNVTPTYQCGVTLSNLNELFEQDMNDALKEGITSFNKKIKGFINDDAIITGVESRTSSPLRILRDRELLESLNTKGLYPAGEGAGYAGGIVSAAIDGIKCAEQIIMKYAK